MLVGGSLEQIRYLAEMLEEIQERCPDIRIIAFSSPTLGEYEPLHYLCFNSYPEYEDWHYIKNLINEENDTRFETHILRELPDVDFFGGVSENIEEDDEGDY
jgi:hypothetical protein